MRRVILPILALVFTVACGGSSPTSPTPTPTPTPTPAPTSGTFSGTVRDSSTNSPLANAVVTITDGENANRAATTDSTGSFSISAVTFGTFTVRTTLSTYETSAQSVTFTSSSGAQALTLSRTKLALSGVWPGGNAAINGSIVQPIITTSITQTGTTFAAGITHQTPGTSIASTAIINGFLSNEFPGATFTGTVVFRTPSTTGGFTCVTGSIAMTGTIISATSISLTAAAPFQYTNCGGTVTAYTLTLLR